jgi:hypothetical protein
MLDLLSGGIIFVMIVFSLWAFGTTEEWSMNIMNGLGYGLGGLLLFKLALRMTSGEGFARWNLGFETAGGEAAEHASRLRWLTRVMAVLSLVFVGYCCVYVVNARFEYNWETRSFDPTASHISWLPSSFDKASSIRVFANYLALALAFWAVVDWIQGKTAADQAAGHDQKDDGRHHARRMPDRLRWLLWGLTLNGGLFALEGMIQRWSGTGELLFFRRPSVTHFEGASQFGSFTYRSNACQYLCLLWPVCLGFWWCLRRMGQSSDYSRRRLARGKTILLVCVLLMILAPMMASSRLGLVTDLLLIVGVVPILHLAMHNMMQKLVLWGGVLCLVIGGLCLGWQYLAPRLESNAFEQSWEQRKIVSENADRISDDYPVFGTGPGSFRAMYQYYMQGSDDWVAQVHNDYVETVVTFGWVGVFLLLALLVSLPIRWLIPGGISMGRRFPLLLYMGLGSCLFQARWDFPFQIYSILFLFLVVGAIASTLTRRRIA